ncbi:MAG: hypothetical protein HY042_05570, partial [Spirochaetia bacterium]|nr:hypothetical protein [Spirochaetia bacterium]
MMFDQPVYIDPSNVLVQAKQEIGARDIERLFKWGIKEVETAGQLMASTSGPNIVPPAAATAPQAETGSPSRNTTNMPEADRVRVHADYEAVRKGKQNFRNVIKEAADLVQVNLQALADNKPFDNHAILNCASRLVDDYLNKPYALLLFSGLRIPHHWS